MPCYTVAEHLRQGGMLPDTVTALVNTPDSPLARRDESARKGDVGSVEDFDDCTGLLFVAFAGRDAIAVDPTEVY